MRCKALLLVLGLAIAAGIGLYATHQSHYLLTEHEKAYHVSLQQSSDGLNALDQAGQNAVAIALDAGLFQKIGFALVGQKVIFSHPSLPGEVLTATVERMSFTPQLGRLVGNVGLRVASDQRFFSLGLSVESALYFSGISQVLPSSPDQPTTFSANFKLLPMSIEPEIAFGFLNIVGRGFVSDIIAGNVVNALSDKLNLAAPYQPRITYTLNKNGEFEQQFGDDNNFKLKYRIHHPIVSIERWVHVIAPVFSNRGVLLAATLSANEATPFAAQGLENVTDASQIRYLQQTLAARIGDAEQYFSGGQMTISIGTGALATLSSDIADALRKLALNLTSTEISGRLFDSLGPTRS